MTVHEHSIFMTFVNATSQSIFYLKPTFLVAVLTNLRSGPDPGGSVFLYTDVGQGRWDWANGERGPESCLS